MVAHLNTVTSLAMDPQQACLLSGSKDKKQKASRSVKEHLPGSFRSRSFDTFMELRK